MGTIKIVQKDEESQKTSWYHPFSGNKKAPTEAPIQFPLIDSIFADDIDYPKITEETGPSLTQKPSFR